MEGVEQRLGTEEQVEHPITYYNLSHKTVLKCLQSGVQRSLGYGRHCVNVCRIEINKD